MIHRKQVKMRWLALAALAAGGAFAGCGSLNDNHITIVDAAGQGGSAGHAAGTSTTPPPCNSVNQKGQLIKPSLISARDPGPVQGVIVSGTYALTVLHSSDPNQLPASSTLVIDASGGVGGIASSAKIDGRD